MSVVPIGPQADWPVSQILESASKEEFSGLVIVGWLDKPKDGRRFWVSSSYNNEESIVYALRCAERLVLNDAFRGEG